MTYQTLYVIVHVCPPHIACDTSKNQVQKTYLRLLNYPEQIHEFLAIGFLISAYIKLIRYYLRITQNSETLLQVSIPWFCVAEMKLSFKRLPYEYGRRLKL